MTANLDLAPASTSIFIFGFACPECAVKRASHLCWYVAGVAAASVLWEAAHMPLYTLWDTGTPAEILADVLKCTSANVAIATACYGAAQLVIGSTKALNQASWGTMAITCILAVTYTIYSEWANVHVWRMWRYSDLMPTIPGIEIGLSPLVQWIVLPSVGILVANRRPG